MCGISILSADHDALLRFCLHLTMRLPPELLSEILDNFYADEVHAFLTVSRSFYRACARSLYHTIKLEDVTKIQNVCETLAFNFTVAGYVRKLVLRPK
jgi:hypothetical protein